MEQQKIPSRQEVDKSLKWKIEDLYTDDEQWKKGYEELKHSLTKFPDFRGKLSQSSDMLLKCLTFSDEVSQLAEKVFVYATMKFHEDTSNNFYQGLADQAQSIMVQLSSVSAFIIPEILSIDEAKLKEFINNNNGLKLYTQFINNLIRQKPHILSAELEELLAQAGDVMDAADNIFSMINDADIKFPDIKGEDGKEVELTKGRYTRFLESNDRKVRKEAFDALYETYLKQKNTLAATFNASVKKDCFVAKVRNYSSALKSALDSTNIPVEVYDNLLSTVHKNLNLMHRYVSIRKKALGVDELHMYDLYTPIVKDVKMEIPFEQAKLEVEKGLQPMGKEYITLLNKGFNEGWIDVVENKGKRSGAYSWGAYGTHPYVLLNYQNNLNYVFTLAHEMGHALHSYYSDANQPYVYAGYKIFVAEVASTVNESLLMDYMIKTSTDKTQKAYLINYFLEQFRGTLFRQTMFAEFEKITHELVEKGEALTVNVLCSIYHKLNEQYFGNDIVIDDYIDIEWARIPHFYNAFYVYQYATGYSAAIALSQNILNNNGVNNYLSFLKGGSSDYPINLLKIAGVDMATPEPIEKAMKVFENLLNQIEELLN